MIARHTRSRQLVLRVLLDFAGGKAECWPCNATIGRIAGLKVRAVQYALRDLEAAGTVRAIPEPGTIHKRRLVLLGHPGSRDAMRPKHHAKECTVQAPCTVTVQEDHVSPCTPVQQNLQEAEKEIVRTASGGPPDDDDRVAQVTERFARIFSRSENS